ncbi:MAG: RNA methyltransferase [Phycisphaerales bacterium]|nr:RNA methyltransferase [Phycisphaerales bacterium]
MSGRNYIDLKRLWELAGGWEHIEGRQSILAAIGAFQRRFQVILIRRGLQARAFQDVLSAAESRNIPYRFVERHELDALTHGASHGGLVAVCSTKPRLNIEQLDHLLASLGVSPLLLVLEGIDDARNLGFTMRSAEAFGAHAILIKRHVWDFDVVEVGRPSSGAYERLPLVQIDDLGPVVGLFRKRQIRLIGCLGGAKRTMYEVSLESGVALAIGGEKRGLSGAMRDVCDGFVRIPMWPGSASSLSLSHAAAVVLAEACRQRQSKRLERDLGENRMRAE